MACCRAAGLEYPSTAAPTDCLSSAGVARKPLGGGFKIVGIIDAEPPTDPGLVVQVARIGRAGVKQLAGQQMASIEHPVRHQSATEADHQQQVCRDDWMNVPAAQTSEQPGRMTNTSPATGRMGQSICPLFTSPAKWAGSIWPAEAPSRAPADNAASFRVARHAARTQPPPRPIRRRPMSSPPHAIRKVRCPH